MTETSLLPFAPESVSLEEFLFSGSVEKPFFILLNGASRHMDIHALYLETPGLLPVFPALADDPPEKHFALPWLLRLHGEDMADRIQDWFGKGCISLIVSRAAPEELGNHLRNLLHAFIPGEERPVWFRLYDPLVLRTFLRSAGAKNLSLFWGNIIEECWLENTPDRGEISVNADYAAPFFFERYLSRQFPEKPDETRLRFTPPQMEAFDEARHDFIVLHACRVVAEKFSPQDAFWPTLRGLIENAVEKASFYNIASVETILAYVECCMVLGWDFAEDPKYAKIIASHGLPDKSKQDFMQTLLNPAWIEDSLLPPGEPDFSRQIDKKY